MWCVWELCVRPSLWLLPPPKAPPAAAAAAAALLRGVRPPARAARSDEVAASTPRCMLELTLSL
jgi:hypothetical protein